MANRVGFAALALGAALAGCSPYGGGAFACTSNDQCSSAGAAGLCSAGYCSFADSTCTSGFRYGDLSGSMSGACVGTTLQDGGPTDRPDGMTASGDSNACYGTGVVHVCFTQPPSGTLSFDTAQTIDTDTSPMCATTVVGASPGCVLAASSFSIGATGSLAATGSKSLVIIATGTVSIAGKLDVSSHRMPTAQLGAGTGTGAACNPGTPPGANGGGAGGSFGGNGGDGGNANKGTHGAAMPNPTTLRGGCVGQAGNAGIGTAGPAGAGGGSVYLFASTSISVAGTINASGAPGGGGSMGGAGGGGGGTGGMIGLEATTVTSTGVIFANGGGGGEGAGLTTTGATPTDPTVGAAPGGAGASTSGGDGGNGATGATKNGGNGNNGMNSGGGGGGGAGVIKVVPVQSLGGMVSPPPS